MKARILFLLGTVLAAACQEPQVSSDAPQIATPSPLPRALYLLRRVAVATDDSLYGLETGTELKLIEERSDGLVVEAQGMQFEIDPRDATNDPDQAERLLARAEEAKAVRRVATVTQWQIEDQRFLAAEVQRSTAEQLEHLYDAIDSAKSEIAGLEAGSLPTDREDDAAAYDAMSRRTVWEDNARRERISFLETYIADCQKKIETLSEAMPPEE